MMKEKEFPILNDNKNLIYLDSAATSQKPRQVINAIEEFYRSYNANIHRGVYDLSVTATEKYEKSKEVIAKFINADKEEIIFTSGATESINLLSSTLPELFKKKNEIVITEMEHHSNLVPWQQASIKFDMKLKYIQITRDYTLDYQQAESIITDRTAIVSIVHTSNAIGTINDIERIIKIAKKYGAIAVIDAAQSASRQKIDVKKLNCDFLVFSGHKMYGPMGIGVLYGKKQILEKMRPFKFGGDMINRVSLYETSFADTPMRFEAGTQNVGGAIGLAEAIKFIEKIGIENIAKHEKDLTDYAIKKLDSIKSIEIYKPKNQSSIISFNIKNIHSHDVAQILNDYNICIRVGHHCCMPLMNKLNIPGTAKVSFGIYNNKKDIDRLINTLKKIEKIFNKNERN